MGDPARQLADRFHLLRLAELFLELETFGEVPDRAEQGRHTFVLDDARRDLRRNIAAVLVNQSVLRRTLGAALEKRPDAFGGAAAVLRMLEVRHLPAG